jgi:hypothetical protein
LDGQGLFIDLFATLTDAQNALVQHRSLGYLPLSE